MTCRKKEKRNETGEMKDENSTWILNAWPLISADHFWASKALILNYFFYFFSFRLLLGLTVLFLPLSIYINESLSLYALHLFLHSR